LPKNYERNNKRTLQTCNISNGGENDNSGVVASIKLVSLRIGMNSANHP